MRTMRLFWFVLNLLAYLVGCDQRSTACSCLVLVGRFLLTCEHWQYSTYLMLQGFSHAGWHEVDSVESPRICMTLMSGPPSSVGILQYLIYIACGYINHKLLQIHFKGNLNCDCTLELKPQSKQ